MPKRKQRWPPKYIEPSTEGRCPYCHACVKNLEAHKRAKHRNEKLIKRK